MENGISRAGVQLIPENIFGDLGNSPQGDLFREIPAEYPNYPGARSAPASREAARAVAPMAGTLRRACLNHYLAIYPKAAAADEVAAVLRRSILSVRPRISELRKSGFVEPTPERARNDSGLRAHRLRASRLALNARDAA